MNQVSMSKVLYKGKVANNEIPYQVMKEDDGENLYLFCGQEVSEAIPVPKHLSHDNEWIEFKGLAFIQQLQKNEDK